MSKEKVTPVSKYKVVRFFLSVLNITEEGKADSFIGKVISYCKAQIEKLEHNKSALEIELKNKKADLEGDVQDAQEILDNSYAQIDLDSIGTNADQKAYVSVYLNNISKAEEKLERTKENLKELEDEYKTKIDSIKTQITSFKTRLEKVSAE